MITTQEAPPRARTAVALLWVSVAVTVVQTIIEDYLSNTSTIGAAAVVFAIYGLVVFRASRRHNWARWVLLVWTVVAAVLYLASVGNHLRPLWAHVLVGLSFTLELIAIYMLFTGAGAIWYRGDVGEAGAF